MWGGKSAMQYHSFMFHLPTPSGIPCFIVYVIPNETIIYKINIILYERLERRNWDHKLSRKLFIEVQNQVRSRDKNYSFTIWLSKFNYISYQMNGIINDFLDV